MIYYNDGNLRLIFILLINMNILSLSDDLLKLIASFLIKPKYKLLDWINQNKLDWRHLSANLNAIQILERNLDKIDWINLSRNPTPYKCSNVI